MTFQCPSPLSHLTYHLASTLTTKSIANVSLNNMDFVAKPLHIAGLLTCLISLGGRRLTDEELADEADNASPASEQSCWESPESSSGENKSGRSTYQPSAESAESDDPKSLLRYPFMLAISLYIRFAAPASPEAFPASERPQCLEASALTTWLRIRLRLTLRARFAAHALLHQPHSRHTL